MLCDIFTSNTLSSGHLKWTFKWRLTYFSDIWRPSKCIRSENLGLFGTKNKIEKKIQKGGVPFPQVPVHISPHF